MDKKIDSVLGQRVSYPQTYTPEVLVAVPRQLNRVELAIADDALPFVGCDAWHAYEASCLTDGGLPVVGVIKLVYPCTSRAIVESKSLKLYLNSFNMERMGSSATEAARQMTETIEKDLRNLLHTEVKAHFFWCREQSQHLDIEQYALLEDTMGDIEISQYTEDPSLLIASKNSGRLRIASHLLRSNCRVTHQPDWGTVFVDIEGESLPDLGGLLRYIVSLRSENHFHEEICELIFTRLYRIFAPEQLMVTCIYTRRGGIDICPMRATSADLFMKNLADCEVMTERGLRG